MMKDGIRTLISFTNLAAVDFVENKVKPPGWDGRGGIDLTNMRTIRYVPMWPKSLVKSKDMTIVVQWNPTLFSTALSFLIQQNQFITVQLPADGSGVVKVIGFYGWVDQFDPSEHAEGELPTASMTTLTSNMNPLGFESGPRLSAGL